MIPSSTSDNCARICGCWCAGNTSIIRLMVEDAELVCSAQRVGEALSVRMQLALVDHAVLVHVDELNRILDGKNVVMALGVDFVDHGRQGGRFTRSCRA